MGSFHNNSPTTVKTIAEVPAVTPIPKNEDYSNQSASIILKTEETESNPPSSADATIDSSSSGSQLYPWKTFDGRRRRQGELHHS